MREIYSFFGGGKKTEGKGSFANFGFGGGWSGLQMCFYRCGGRFSSICTPTCYNIIADRKKVTLQRKKVKLHRANVKLHYKKVTSLHKKVKLQRSKVKLHHKKVKLQGKNIKSQRINVKLQS